MARSCESCGVAVEGVGRGRPRRFCLDCRPRKRPISLAHTRAAVSACQSCGVSFDGARKYCSDSCKDAARPRIACYVCGEPTGWYASDGRAGVAVKHQKCAMPHGSVARYKAGCRCVECRTENAADRRAYVARRRAEGRPLRKHGGSGPYIPERVRAAVYGRDGYVCQICFAVCDVGGDPNSNSFPSLDHIIPKSLGGGHTVHNLRTACRGCNSARGARLDVAS